MARFWENWTERKRKKGVFIRIYKAVVMLHQLSLEVIFSLYSIPYRKKPLNILKMSPQLNCEENRLRTFNGNWPLSFINPSVLAKTGFHYIGPHDLVRCYFCKMDVYAWENGENEVEEHLRWSPNCPLLTRRKTDNLPLEPAADLFQLLPPESIDECGIYKNMDRRLEVDRVGVPPICYYDIVNRTVKSDDAETFASKQREFRE